MSEKKYAIVYTWPGTTANAESEVIKRMLIAAKNIGMHIDVISESGVILNEDMLTTEQKIHDNEYEFIMTIHYDDCKILDSFYYHILWNPPLIPLQYSNYTQIQKKIISNDDFLIYDDGGMSDHLRVMLIDSPRNLEGASSLTAAFPKTLVKKPELTNPTLFYCGTNWEKLVGVKPRHDGLFKSLDKMDCVKIYGPKFAWKGFKRYKGIIPFDGVSLIDAIHECGIVLALSSDSHYRAGAATNRVYEGCVAGAVVISDTNKFIKEHFGDSVLYFDYNPEHPEKMFEQIKKHIDWVRENPKDALKLAQKSQKIFLEQFTLEKQLTDILNNHENRKKAVADALYSKNSDTNTLVVGFIDSPIFADTEKNILANIINNIEKQIDKNIVLTICCDVKIANEIQKYIDTLNINKKIILKSFNIFDEFNYKWLSRGQMLLDVIESTPHDYLCVLNGAETMFSDHITTLKRTLEENPDKIAAYAGMFKDDKNQRREPFLQKCLSNNDIYKCNLYDYSDCLSGNFLMNKKIESYFNKYICKYLDGMEVFGLLNLAIFKHKDDIIYSKRTTFGISELIDYSYPKTIDVKKQINLVHGLITFDYIPSDNNFLDEDARKILMRLKYLKLSINILLVKIRNHFIFTKKHRKKNKIRLEYYLQKKDLCRQTMKQLV